MSVHEIEAKSILRKYKKIDSWFLARYGMNLYRGCLHDCIYCDGRDEKYYVEGDFGKDVSVKVNAIDILNKELSPKIKRKPLKKGFIVLGGGVGDSYQPIEEKYLLTRRTLKLLQEYGFPVHILTKSSLVKRDVDIITKINENSRAIVSFSFSSTDEELSKIFEPNASTPKERLDTIRLFTDKGISCGAFLMPVIPFVTDTVDIMDKSIRDIKAAGATFIIFGGMTLKEGKQKDYFMKELETRYPLLVPRYDVIYKKNKWGNASNDYCKSINQLYNVLTKKYSIAKRIPAHLYNDILDENDLVVVILEHIDYLLKLEDRESPYGFSAYSISQIKEPLSLLINELTKIKGVGRVTERLIKEILETKNCSYLQKLQNMLK